MNDNLFVGKALITLPTVDSTNDYAKELLSKSKPFEGTAIFADYQEQGRGQYGKSWESKKGENLIVSIILYPSFIKPAHIFLLNQAMSLALMDYVADFTRVPVNVKWPNDIYCNGQKIAGLLIESSISNNRLNYAVIGIGINVNQTKFSPKSKNPTSLKLITGKDFDLAKILEMVCTKIEQRYLQLKTGDHKIEKEYTNNLFQLNQPKNYQTTDGKISGTIKGIDAFGQLRIEVNGDIRCYRNNEVNYL